MPLFTNRRSSHAVAALALAVLLSSACASANSASTPAPQAADEHAGHQQAADEHAGHAADERAGHVMHNLPPVSLPAGTLITEADVRFMQMMIGHHAQAVYMTRLAEAAGASDRVLRLATKIDLSQAGEIALMQGWLAEYGQHVPGMDSWREMAMPGLLTAAQMQQLSAARGRDFDRLFLRLMITHHEGAIQMVHELLGTSRAGQEVDINVLANEIEAAQLAEIELMWQMLAELR